AGAAGTAAQALAGAGARVLPRGRVRRGDPGGDPAAQGRPRPDGTGPSGTARRPVAGQLAGTGLGWVGAPSRRATTRAASAGESRLSRLTSAVRPMLISYWSAAIPASTALATWAGVIFAPCRSLTGSVSTSGGSTSKTFTGVCARAIRSERENECSAAFVAA